MGEKWDVFKIRCPFYVDHSKYSVKCEGLLGDEPNDAEFTSMGFEIPSARRDHMMTYCRSNYHKCPLFRALSEQKYDDKEY